MYKKIHQHLIRVKTPNTNERLERPSQIFLKITPHVYYGEINVRKFVFIIIFK